MDLKFLFFTPFRGQAMSPTSPTSPQTVILTESTSKCGLYMYQGYG
jgi:hypothetical protein